jgi:hypothetical protein
MYNWPVRYNNEMAIFSDPQKIWPQAQKDYNFKIVIMDSTDPVELNFLKYLGTQPAWQLIDVSGAYVIYVKRGEFHLPKELDSYEVMLRSTKVSTNDLQVLKGSIDRKKALAGQGFVQAADIDLYLDTFTFFNLGYKGAAVKDLIKALNISDLPDLRNDAVYILKQELNSKS